MSDLQKLRDQIRHSAAHLLAEAVLKIYPDAKLTIGPAIEDGLMVGLQIKTNLPIAAVRAILEITVVCIGWYLGGTVGIGTLIFAFGIGPCVALGLFLVNKFFN